MNNLYLVVSEELQDHRPPYDWYRIAELVIAKNHSQARYLAWKTDTGNTYSSFSPDLRDMPKFSCRLRLKGVDMEPCVVSDKSEFGECW